MSELPLAPQFLRQPDDWVAVPGCVCRAAGGVGFVHDVMSEPVVYAAGSGGALPGLTPEETAILAGVLTGLATFLFLLLPILCCLCPLCPCCGWAGGKKKGAAMSGHRHGNVARNGSDESFWSTGSWGGGDKLDYENLYGVDMKLPRPWVDNEGVRQLDRDGEWEGADMTREEIEAARAGRAGGGGEGVAETGIVTYASGEQGGSNANGGTMYSTSDRRAGGGDGGEEVVTEYATTRRVDIQFGGMNPTDAEGYYTTHYGQNPDMSKDNFMKLYWAYRNQADGRD